MSKRLFTLMPAVVLSTLCRTALPDQLLATYTYPPSSPPQPADYIGGWGSSPPPVHDQFFRLMFVLAPTPGSGAQPDVLRIGITTVHGLQSPGIFDYTAANEPLWNAAVALLTNGVENGVDVHMERSLNDPFFPRPLNTESVLGLNQQLLHDAEITKIRLRFNGVIFSTPVNNFGTVQGSGFWEVWGNPVPGPGSVAVAVGFLGASWPRRRR